MPDKTTIDFPALALAIKAWSRELGFADLRVTDIDLTHAEAGLAAWLDAGYHGDTIGTMSVSAVDLFNKVFSPLFFSSFKIFQSFESILFT